MERNVVEFPSDLPDSGLAGQRFVIKSVSERRDGLRVTKSVEAHHVAFDLNRYFLDDYVDFSANQPPSYPLSLIGNGTPYTLATAGDFANMDIFEFGETYKYTLLTEMAKLYGGELAYNNEQITLTKRKGADYGVEIRYRKNLAGITRKSSEMNRVTRLYGYGKNGLTIEGFDIHNVKYIDSPYIDSAHIYEGSISFPDIEDKSRLLAAMKKHLATVELPEVVYDVDYVQLEKAGRPFDLVAIRGVGDTITVIDEDLGYNFSARVTDYERYPFEPKRARIALANFKELTTADYVSDALYSGQKAIIYTSKNAVLKGIKYDDSITLVDGMGIAVSDDLDRIRVRLGQVAAGEYGITAYNKAGQRTFWLDATTGDARFSGRIEGSDFITNPGAYPSVELTSDSNVFRASKSDTSYIVIEADPESYTSPIINHTSGSVSAFTGIQSGAYFSLVGGGNYDIGASSGAVRINGGTISLSSSQITLNSDVYVPAGNDVELSSTSRLFFGSTSLSSILNGIYSRLSVLESA